MTSSPHKDPAFPPADPHRPTIRRMTVADIDPVFALERATPEATHWPRRGYERIVRGQPEAEPLTRAALIADLDGHLAGFAVIRLLRLRASSIHNEELHCELESIVVAADLRGRGLGSHLMNAVFDLAISSSAHRLELEVRSGNQAAMRLYNRAGLSVEGHRPRYYSDPAEDAVLMGINFHLAKSPHIADASPT